MSGPSDRSLFSIVRGRGPVLKQYNRQHVKTHEDTSPEDPGITRENPMKKSFQSFSDIVLSFSMKDLQAWHRGIHIRHKSFRSMLLQTLAF